MSGPEIGREMRETAAEPSLAGDGRAEGALGYVTLAVVSGLLYGTWKFGLGVYRHRISRYAIVLVSASAAACAYAVFGALSGSLTFNGEDIAAGLVGGALNLAGTLLLLQAFQHGKIGVVSGVAATYVMVPLAYSFLVGERIPLVTAVGVVVILAGVAVFYAGSLKRSDDMPSRSSPVALALALGSALLWGVAVVVLDLGTRVSLTGALTMSQVPQVVFTLAVLLAGAHQAWAGVSPRALAVLVGAGLALALGNLAYFAAANEGDIGVVSVLASLSPLVTALLAAAFLQERLARLEVVALAIVVVGTALVVL